MYSRLCLGLFSAMTLALGGCSSTHEDGWSYEGGNGPLHWHELSPEFETCSTGQAQSPIDLGGAVVGPAQPITFHYGRTHIHLENDGRTVHMNPDRGSWIRVGQLRYDLEHIHFHAPGEHTVDGKSHPLEAHFVHRSWNDRLAVVAISFVEGTESLALRPVFADLPTEAEAWRRDYTEIDLAAFLPEKRGFYRYQGSLTTPPCTEKVQWTVMHEPTELAPSQIAAFTSLHPNSRRPVQPANGRVPILSWPSR